MSEELFEQAEVPRTGSPRISLIERVPLREVWRHEAHDFTRWLAENPEALSDATGLSLSTIEREQSTGNFSIDLVAEDAAGNKVVIENQLEKSDHDHLGKLITYLAAVPEAKTAIWITSDPRPEHVDAITWLNESYAADLYLIKIEAVRIGDSPAAPLLTKIVGPSADARAVAANSKEWAVREHLRFDFWKELLERARKVNDWHSAISPGRYSYISAGAGRSGLSYLYNVRVSNGYVSLYIDSGNQDANYAIFDALLEQRDVIDAEFGEGLEWERAETVRASWIVYHTHKGGWESPKADWPAIHDEMIDAMDRLARALSPRIAQLPK